MMEIQNIHKIKDAIEYMEPFFDVVRLVDTRQTKVMSFSSKNNSITEDHICYKIWNKQERCPNCTSMEALIAGKQKEKYEFRGDEVYHVASKPIKVIDEKGEAYEIVLEIVNGISDNTIFEKLGISEDKGKTTIELIADAYRKIYEDALTSVYNRRYLDEFRFLYHNNDQVSSKVAFIMIDLKEFKKINDTMGHETGDRILVEVASVFKENVCKKDSVIRLGGDEFVIILVDCEEEQVISKMELLRNEVKKVHLGYQEQIQVDIDWGYSYTEDFRISRDYLDIMLKQADEAMYIMKKS